MSLKTNHKILISIAIIAAAAGLYFGIDAGLKQSSDSPVSVQNSSLAADPNHPSASGQKEQAQEQATLTTFLKTSLEPKDQVLYVWGGGWNEEDTGGNEEANSIGLAPSWKTFFDANKNNYDASQHTYQIHDGLDCSGYVGWTLHNTFKDSQDYVSLSENYGEFLSSLGYGAARPSQDITEILPGDIMYTTDGHVYIVIGQYDDGSILLMHSSPPGVRLSGTYGKAYEKALEYQSAGWDPLVDQTYLGYSQFRFNEETLPDPDHLKEKTPDEVVEFLFGAPQAQTQE